VKLDTHRHDGEGELGMTGQAPAPGAIPMAAIQVISSGEALVTAGVSDHFHQFVRAVRSHMSAGAADSAGGGQ
jgi:hypothetical protein